MPPSAGTASGTSHQYRAASIRIASVIQYKPTRKLPQPNQKPRRMATSGFRAPSISVSKGGPAISSTGMAFTGGSAAAARIPKPRKPSDRPATRAGPAAGRAVAEQQHQPTTRSGGTGPPVSTATTHSAAITPIATRELGRHAGDMRCGDHPVMPAQPDNRPGGGSPSNTSSPAPAIWPLSKRGEQRNFVDQPAPGGVDHEGRRPAIVRQRMPHRSCAGSAVWMGSAGDSTSDRASSVRQRQARAGCVMRHRPYRMPRPAAKRWRPISPNPTRPSRSPATSRTAPGGAAPMPGGDMGRQRLQILHQRQDHGQRMLGDGAGYWSPGARVTRMPRCRGGLPDPHPPPPRHAGR